MFKLRPHQAAGILISLASAIVMAGWWTQQPRLVHLPPEYFPMVYNTALCFFMAGIALQLPESRPSLRSRGMRTAGVLIIVLAALSGLQSLLNVDLGIDQLFAKHWFVDRYPHPGRMAPLTSLGFVLTGACFLLMHRLRVSRAARLAVQVLVHTILGIGILGLVGYPLKLELLYGWYRFARMAPHVAIGFILAGSALWSVWFQECKRSGAFDGREDKRIAARATLLLFVLAFAGGLTGFVLSTQRTEASIRHNLEAALANRTQLVESVIGDGLQQSQALAADPAILELLRHGGTRSTPATDRLLGAIFSGVTVLSTDEAILSQQGHFMTSAPMTLPLGLGASLLWNQRTVLQLTTPIVQDGERVGTLVTQRALPAIDRLLSGARMLGATGDVIICAALGADRMRCLPSNLVPAGQLSASRRGDGKPWPASLALDGQAGVTALPDGRGEYVIAAYGPVAGFGLSMVVKQDTAELYGQIRSQLTNLLVMLVLLVGSSLLLLRSQLLPLVASLSRAKRDADTNEARIRAVVDNVADGLITIDAQGAIESLNPAAAAMFGYTQQEAVGQNVELLIPTHLKRAHAEGLARYTRTGSPDLMSPRNIEVQGRRKDGVEFPIQISIREMLLQGKRTFVGIVRDISERRNAEQEMRKAEERFRLVSQATNDVVWDLDFITGQTWWNDAITRQFGYAPESVESGPDWWRARIHPDDRDALLRRIDAEVAGGCRSWAADYRFARADGSYTYVHDRAYIIRDSEGSPTRAVGAMMDVTERKRAEEALSESEEKFRSIVETTKDWIWWIDPYGRMLYANPAVENILGYLPEELLGTNILDRLPLNAQKEVASKLSILVAEKRTWTNMLLRWRHKDGSDRYTQSSAVPVFGEGGQLLGYRGSDHDITLLKRYEQDLEESTHKAESANQAKSEFLANMSHEIRTPMNGVIGLTNLLLNTALSAQQREYLGLMKSSADSLLRLLNDILDFSKMEARKLELDMIEFDVREAVGNTLRAFSASASEKDVELALHIAPEVPALLLGDPGRLAQIIVNLTGNALKFTSQGEIVLRIARAAQDDTSAVLHISMADSGIGMSAEQQTRIFAAFAQADSSTTRQYGGTGLGLTIVAQLVALMDGKMWVESALGAGTTFHLTVRLGLPQQAASALEQRHALKDLPVPLPGDTWTCSPARRLNILVAEDHPINQILVTTLLAEWGYACSIASNGAEVLRMLDAPDQKPFDLILMDGQMPEMDGYQATAEIRRREQATGRHIHIIAVTAHAMKDDRDTCLAAGMDDYLSKPIDQDQLRAMLAAAPVSAERSSLKGS